MFVRLSAAIAAMSLLGSARLRKARKADRSADRAYRLHRRGHRHRRGEAGDDKSSNKDVKAFAADMVRDHEAVNKQALDLVKKLKVTPEDNDTSKALSKQRPTSSRNSEVKGAEFDKAYVANEVAYHKAVNGALETLLIPSASNAELKSLLQTGLKIFQGHQQHAEQVAAELK